MAIVAGDILLKYTVKTGAAGNSTGGTAGGSLGKYLSTTTWTGGSLNDLFDDVTGDENAASNVEYRCIGILNNHGSLTAQTFKVWVSAEVSGGTSVAIAVDSTAASAKGASAAQALEIADEDTEPSPTLEFSTPTSKATGLTVGDVAAGYCRMIWVRRTAANSAAKDADGFTLSWACDTAA